MSNNNHITIKSSGKEVQVNYDDILYIKSLGDYLKLVTPTKRFVTHCTVKAMQSQVNPKAFMRVRRSFIVNFTKVSDLKEKSLVIVGNTIPISKPYRNQIKQALAQTISAPAFARNSN